MPIYLYNFSLSPDANDPSGTMNMSMYNKKHIRINLTNINNFTNQGKKENILLGYAFFSIVATDSHLLNIAVSRNYQGKGYGRKILEKVILQSSLLGATVIFLEVRISNHRAINFYQKFGFKRDAIRYEYYKGNPKEDALLMSKQGL